MTVIIVFGLQRHNSIFHFILVDLSIQLLHSSSGSNSWYFPSRYTSGCASEVSFAITIIFSYCNDLGGPRVCNVDAEWRGSKFDSR